MAPFVADTIGLDDFGSMVGMPMAFGPPGGPLVELGPGITCSSFPRPDPAFKDVALQLLGRLFDHHLERRDQRVTMWGDIGRHGSAMDAVCDRISRHRHPLSEGPHE